LLRRVGLCPALEFSYPRISSLQWVTYLVRMHGFTQQDATQRAIEALKLVRLDHVMHRPMTECSLGMRQRAKIAQAIAHDPELLILDEPFNGLDPVGRFEMTGLLKQWAADGRSLILASHILHEVEAVDPSFLLIYGGRLMASGSPAEMRRILADSPNTLTIRTSDPNRLAAYLTKDAAIKNLKFVGDDMVEIETLSASSVLQQLPAAAAEAHIEIMEVVSSDESLKALFSTLMKIHRGEIETRVSQ
jgi:ABC-2 type transport system ATP-binding protein